MAAIVVALMSIPASGFLGPGRCPGASTGPGVPRSAVMTTALLELGQSTFEFIVKEYPFVQTQIYETARARGGDATAPS